MNEELRQEPAYLTIAGSIATITLDRPDQYNAINDRMAVRLRDLAREVERNNEVRALVLRGEGAAFCGGGDIRHFVSNLDTIGNAIRDLLTPYHEFLWLLRHMPKLTIASVHGPAAGAGLSLAAMCDLCIASDKARFTPAFSNLGVSPDSGGTYGLPRAIGARRALHVFLGEDSFSAEQAASWGLVTRLVPHEALVEETLAYAKRLCRTSAAVIESTKRLLRESAKAELHDHLIDEMESLIRCMDTEMFKGAVKRFVEKR